MNIETKYSIGEIVCYLPVKSYRNGLITAIRTTTIGKSFTENGFESNSTRIIYLVHAGNANIWVEEEDLYKDPVLVKPIKHKLDKTGNRILEKA